MNNTEKVTIEPTVPVGVPLDQRVEQWNTVARHINEAAGVMVAPMTPAFQGAASALNHCLGIYGLVPPCDPRRGDKWTSPLDGTRYRAVGGKRGKPVTWHEVQRRQRWWK